MTQLTLVIWLAVITAQQFKSVPEASEIEKPEIESEECGGGNKPQHDRRQLGQKTLTSRKMKPATASVTGCMAALMVASIPFAEADGLKN